MAGEGDPPPADPGADREGDPSASASRARGGDTATGGRGLPALVAFFLALAAGAGVRAWQIGGRTALSWNDTADFLAISAERWASVGLWAGARAPGVPVALKLVGGDGERFVDLQAGVAVACWAALCASVATVVAGRWPRAVAVATVLAFSVTTPVTMWERSVLSESPGVSLVALVVAAGLQVARGVTWPRVALLLSALVPWLAVRDTHAVVALTGGVAALVVVAALALVERRRRSLIAHDEGDGADEDAAAAASTTTEATGPGTVAKPSRRAGRPLAVLGALAVGLGLLVLAGAAHGERQAFPTRNVYEVRILPYADRVRWFAEHGMPQADVFLGPDARRPYREPGLPPVVYVPDDDPELREWLAWVEGDGRVALARFALSHPGYLLREPLHVPERTFNNARGDRSFYAPLDHPHVPLVDTLLAHRTAVVLLVAGMVGGWAIARRLATPALVAGAVTAVLALPHGAVAWHTDGMEAARHLVVPAVQFHLGVLLMVVGLLPAAAAAATATEPRRADEVASAHG